MSRSKMSRSKMSRSKLQITSLRAEQWRSSKMSRSKMSRKKMCPGQKMSRSKMSWPRSKNVPVKNVMAPVKKCPGQNMSRSKNVPVKKCCSELTHVLKVGWRMSWLDQTSEGWLDSGSDSYWPTLDVHNAGLAVPKTSHINYVPSVEGWDHLLDNPNDNPDEMWLISCGGLGHSC